MCTKKSSSEQFWKSGVCAPCDGDELKLHFMTARCGLAPQGSGASHRFSSRASPLPQLPIGVLPPTLRPWLNDVAYRMDIPLDYLAAACLVAASSIIGRRRQSDPGQRSVGRARQSLGTSCHATWRVEITINSNRAEADL